MANENVLVGKTLEGIKLTEDRKAILFVTDSEEILAHCDADCCSETWVEHIELPALGFPATAMFTEKLELPGSDDNHPIHDCLQVYGLKISTDKGDIVIDYRNASNGYYGGWLEWDDEDFYGGVFGQNNSELSWVDVTEDI